MLVYKFDVFEKLKEKGINTSVMRKNNYFGQRTIQELKVGKVVGTTSLNTLCKLLDLQPGSILKYVPDDDENGNNSEM